MIAIVEDQTVPKGWKPYRFAEMLVDGALSYGIVQPGSHRDVDSVPIVRVNNIRNGQIETHDVLKVATEIEAQYARTRLSGGELLITVVGTVGECAIVPDALVGWNVARAVSVARIKPEFDARFVKYCFKLDDVVFQMYGNTNDTVQPTLNLAMLKSLVLTAPDLDEQSAIASVLASLDSKIDLLHSENKTIEAMAETLFRGWFGNETNADWPEGTVEDLFLLQRGYDLPAQDRIDGPYAIVTSSGLSGRHNKFKIKPPGVATGRSGLIGKVFLIQENFWPLNTALYVKEFKRASPMFTYLFLKAMDLPAFNAGSAVPTLNRNHVHAHTVRLPPCELIARLESAVAPLFRKVHRNGAQIASLMELRDNLLPKLMSGEVRVAY